MDPRVRPSSLSHLDHIIAIERLSYASPWPSSVFVDEMQHEWSRIWGYFPGGFQAPVGFVLFWEIYDEVHILNLAVHPRYRRKSVARALLAALFEHSRGHGFKFVTLEVRRSNQGAIDLYKSFGFRVEGVRKGYYSDNLEDALIMVSPLSEATRKTG
jgi:ribosomal-protein-alanine N-acetyltransferase